MKQWLKAAGIRAIKTFAETMISMLTIGRAFVEIDWLHIISVSGVAAVIALLTCIARLREVDTSIDLPTDLLDEITDGRGDDE